MNKKFSTKYKITNDCMDINYRLTPMSAIMYFQDTVARYMTSKNVAAFDIIDKGLFWVVSEFDITYNNILPFWSEDIEVSIWISEISKLKMYTDFELKWNNEVFAKGNACWYILNQETRRPTLIQETIKGIDIKENEKHAKFCFETVENEVSKIRHTITFNDIDFNKHTNNKSYISLAANTITEEYKNTHSIKNLKVKFYRETFIDDNLCCTTFNTGNNNIFVHKIEKDDEVVCQIQTTWQTRSKMQDIKDYELRVRSSSPVGIL